MHACAVCVAPLPSPPLPPGLCPSSSRRRSAAWLVLHRTDNLHFSSSLPPGHSHALPVLGDATPLHGLPENPFVSCGSSALIGSSMPDAGTAAAGAAAAAAAASSGNGSESSRHRHRPQQGEAERPEPGSGPQQSSSGVLGESSVGFVSEEVEDRWCSRAASLPLSPPGRPKTTHLWHYRPVNVELTYHLTAAFQTCPFYALLNFMASSSTPQELVLTFLLVHQPLTPDRPNHRHRVPISAGWDA